MNPRLVHHYNVELAHLRGMAAEFAQAFPKIAARLRLDDLEVTDPHVERLLEGFAFLAARIQLKLDAEFPRLTRNLLQALHPQYLEPIPAMVIVQFEPQAGESALIGGSNVPRGAVVKTTSRRNDMAPCRFTIAHEVTLWPFALKSVAYVQHASGVDLEGAVEWRRHAAAIRLTLRTLDPAGFNGTHCDRLRLHVRGPDEVAMKLHELVVGHALGLVLRSPDGRSVKLSPQAIVPVGFEDEHALLQPARPGLQAFRLLQEYFAFPQRFLFFDIVGIASALRQLGGSDVEVIVLLETSEPSLALRVNDQSLALYCAPAINAFEHTCDRIHVTESQESHTVVPDRTRPLDYEVLEVVEVSGHGLGLGGERRFLPLYAFDKDDGARPPAWFTVSREPRGLSMKQRRDGPRSTYLGSDVSISVVDLEEAPHPQALQQLAVKARCSNRDLPVLMLGPSHSATGVFTLERSAPVSSVNLICGPTRPLQPVREGSVSWQLVNLFSTSQVGLLQAREPAALAVVLREHLALHLPQADASLRRQVDAVVGVKVTSVVRRLSMPGPMAFGKGLHVDVEVDEQGFEGASAFLFGLVLSRYLARQVSLNSFIELSLRSSSRGLIHAGAPLAGTRAVI